MAIVAPGARQGPLPARVGAPRSLVLLMCAASAAPRPRGGDGYTLWVDVHILGIRKWTPIVKSCAPQPEGVSDRFPGTFIEMAQGTER
jgi:hypothetical protein